MWAPLIAGLLLATPPGEVYRAIIDRAIDRASAGAALTDTDDATFLRRATIDATGVVPDARAVTGFIASVSKDKRAELIARLLDDKRAASHFAEIWSKTLLGPFEPMRERRINRTLFSRWLTDSFADPWDKTTTAMITATGSPDLDPPVNFLLAQMSPEELIGNMSRIFMAVGMQCAECHDHPEQNISRRDFYGMLAFFGRTQLRVEKLAMVPEEARRNMSPAMEERIERELAKAKERGNETPYARPVIADRAFGELMFPDSNEPVRPKLLGGDKPERGSGHVQRLELASYITARETGYFARAFVNRTWAQLMGRPLADSIDDLGLDKCGAKEKTAAQDLLCELARAFADNGLQPKSLMLGIMSSHAYRVSTDRGSRPPAAVEALAVRQIKPLSPEELYATLLMVTGAEKMFAKGDPLRRSRMKETALIGLSQLYGEDEEKPGAAPIATVPLSLTMMNGEALNKAITPFPGGTIDRLYRDVEDTGERVRTLFIIALSRPPRADELEYFEEMLEGTEGRPRKQRQAYADMLWAMINSTEFVYNH
jgi:hypothetical protein